MSMLVINHLEGILIKVMIDNSIRSLPVTQEHHVASYRAFLMVQWVIELIPDGGPIHDWCKKTMLYTILSVL